MPGPAPTSRKRDLLIALGLSLAFNGFVLLVLKEKITVSDKILEALFTLCLPGVLLAGQVVKQNLVGMIALAVLLNVLLQTVVLYFVKRVLQRVLRTFRT